MSVRVRTFKTKWFVKAAQAHNVADSELCQAIQCVRCGQAENLGGGIYKRRLSCQRDRAIILAKGGANWIYTYLFAKQDRTNINDKELSQFKELAKHYAELTDDAINKLLSNKALVEICHDH